MARRKPAAASLAKPARASSTESMPWSPARFVAFAAAAAFLAVVVVVVRPKPAIPLPPAETGLAVGAEALKPTVSQRKAGFSAADIAAVLEVEKNVWAETTQPHLSNHSRVFGEGSDSLAGHSATFLHAHVGATPQGRALMDKLLKLTMELEAEAGWGIAGSSVLSRLRPRAVESLRYSLGDRDADSTGQPAAGEIGWHSDFMSVMTVTVMLSASDARTGGGFQTRRLGPNDPRQSYELELGDVSVWRSWDRHRVGPLTGHRHVLAVQWWIAPAHTDVRSGPGPAYHFTEGPDMLLPYCAAILSPDVDPDSYYAAQICGKFIGNAGMKQYGQDLPAAIALLQTSVRYHKRAEVVARLGGSAMERQPVLSQAQRLSMVYFAPGKRPKRKEVVRVLALCQRAHVLGAALRLGESPFDTEMDKEALPAGQQKDLGGTALRMLKQVIAVKALNLGTHAQFERKYPFLKLYWS